MHTQMPDKDASADNVKTPDLQARLGFTDEKFATLFFYSPIAFAISELESGEILEVNDAFLKLFGFTRKEVVGNSRINLRIMTPEERESITGALKKEGRVMDRRMRRRRKGGELVDISTTAALFNFDGKPHIFTMNVDISEQVRLENELKKSEQKFSTIFYNSAEAMLLSGLSGEILYCNDAFLEMLDYADRSEVVGRTTNEIRMIVDQRVREEYMTRLRQEGFIKRVEYRIRKKGGEVLTVLLSSRLVDIDGKKTLLSTMVDVTDRKRMEKELREEDTKKNQFISILSHELRNPLAPVRTYTELLQHALQSETIDRHELQEAANAISRQVNTMTQLLDDLLDVSRIVNNKIKLEKEPVDLSAIARRAIETSVPHFDAKCIALIAGLSGEALIINADSLRIEQVLVNMLNNAAKYSPENSTVWVTTKKLGSQALVSIRDQGIGIPPEMTSKIFDLFTQADQTLNRPQGGLGIGLAMAKNLVTMHSGIIEVVSDSSREGSEFIIRLPLYV